MDSLCGSVDGRETACSFLSGAAIPISNWLLHLLNLVNKCLLLPNFLLERSFIKVYLPTCFERHGRGA